jgi:hypothetical protein
MKFLLIPLFLLMLLSPAYSEDPVMHKGHRYLFIPEKVTWEDALKLASDNHGHLVYINNAAENKFVLDYVKKRSSSIWLGAEFHKKKLGRIPKRPGNGFRDDGGFGDYDADAFGQQRTPIRRLGGREPGNAKPQALWKAPHYQEPLKFWPDGGDGGLINEYRPNIPYKEDDRLCMVCKAARERVGLRDGRIDYGHGRWYISGENALRHVVIEWDKK